MRSDHDIICLLLKKAVALNISMYSEHTLALFILVTANSYAINRQHKVSIKCSNFAPALFRVNFTEICVYVVALFKFSRANCRLFGIEDIQLAATYNQ